MTTLRTIVGACNKYVKVLKKKLVGKRDKGRRWLARHAAEATANCYDNEAVDNMINEFIDHKKTVGEYRL